MQTVIELSPADSAHVSSRSTLTPRARLRLLPATDTALLTSVFTPLEHHPSLALLPVAPIESLGARIQRLHPDAVIVALQTVSAAPWQQDPGWRTLFSATPAILLTPAVNRDARRLAADLRIDSILPQHLAPRRLLAAVHSAAAGLAVTLPQRSERASEPPNATERILRDAPLVERLTPRETAVLDCIAHGCGNKQIAAQLDISEHTAKFHVSSILAKLGASSRTEAVTIGILTGLIAI